MQNPRPSDPPKLIQTMIRTVTYVVWLIMMALAILALQALAYGIAGGR